MRNRYTLYIDYVGNGCVGNSYVGIPFDDLPPAILEMNLQVGNQRIVAMNITDNKTMTVVEWWTREDRNAGH